MDFPCELVSGPPQTAAGPGVARVSSGTFSFTPSSAAAFSVAVAEISKKQTSKALPPKLQLVTTAGALVFKFSDASVRDALLAALNSSAQHTAVSASPDAPSSRGAARSIESLLSNNDVSALKKAVFDSTPGLLVRYRELVGGTSALLSEAEFWTSAKMSELLFIEASKRAPRGVSGALPELETCLRVVRGVGGAPDSTHLEVTEEVRRATLSREPRVAAFFAAAVPARISQERFWEGLLSARAKRRVALVAATDGQSSAMRAENLRKAAAVDISRLSPDEFFDLYGRGVFDEVGGGRGAGGGRTGDPGRAPRALDLAATVADGYSRATWDSAFDAGDMVTHHLMAGEGAAGGGAGRGQKRERETSSTTLAVAADAARCSEREAGLVINDHNNNSYSVLAGIAGSGAESGGSSAPVAPLDSAADDFPDLHRDPLRAPAPGVPLSADLRARLRARLRYEHVGGGGGEAAEADSGGWGVVEVGVGRAGDDDGRPPTAETVAAIPAPANAPIEVPDAIAPLTFLRSRRSSHANALFAIIRKSHDLWSVESRSSDGFASVVPPAWRIALLARATANNDTLRRAWEGTLRRDRVAPALSTAALELSKLRGAVLKEGALAIDPRTGDILSKPFAGDKEEATAEVTRLLAMLEGYLVRSREEFE